MAMRILGLDPGSLHTGFGCVEQRRGTCCLVEHGRFSLGGGNPLPDRLGELARLLGQLLDRWHPEVAVLETPFHGVNSRSLIVLAQARGALLATLALRGIAIEEFSPAEVKSAVTGNGRAGKDQVARMVARLLPGAGTVSADAADALAVALCYSARRPLLRAVAALGGSGRGGKSAAARRVD
jgi:crossover junction endodeoxyribonuclease RuvC